MHPSLTPPHPTPGSHPSPAPLPLRPPCRFGTFFVDYRGSVPACAGFEVFDAARKLVHGLLVGAWIGERLSTQQRQQ